MTQRCRVTHRHLTTVWQCGHFIYACDQYINISVYIPETLNKEEREAIEKLRNSENIKPTEEKKKSIFQRMRDFFQ